VIDLRKRFDLKECDVSANTRLLIVSLATQLLALVVDEVTEVVSVQTRDIKPPPQLGEGINSNYLIGVCLVKQDLIMLLNIDQLLSRQETSELGTIHSIVTEE
jgi:purine-binding chemotaxis protein CheW